MSDNMSDTSDTLDKGTKALEDIDAFIAHHNDDNLIAKRLYNFLAKQNLKVRACFTGEGEFRPGTVIFYAIVNTIRASKMTLVVLTDKTLKSLWVRIELMLAIDKSMATKKNCLKLLFWNIDNETEYELKTTVFSRLEDSCFYSLPDRDWTEEDLEGIMGGQEKDLFIKGSEHLGNIAHAVAYSYYAGFLGTILKDLTNGMKRHEDSAIDKNQMPRKFYVILPDSCLSLEDYIKKRKDKHGRLKKMEKAIIFPGWVAGTNRDKDAPVYCITEGDQNYFFAGESPSAIRPFINLNAAGFDDLKVETKFQLARFYHTLKDLLFHGSLEPSVFKLVEIVWFDDETESLEDKLLPMIKADLKRDQDDPHPDQMQGIRPVLETDSNTVYRPLEQPGMESEILFLLDEDSDEDKRVYERIVDSLRSKNIECTTIRPGQTAFSCFSTNTKWFVFLLTKSGIRNKLLMAQLTTGFYMSMEKRKIKLLCVKHDVEYSELPECASVTLCLDAKVEKDLESLARTLKGDNPDMMVDLQAGDLATGLAWAYVENYLCHSLTDLEQRMREKCPADCILVEKLFLLFTKSCKCPDKESYLIQGEENLGSLTSIESGTRTYKLHLFRKSLQSGTVVCYTREYSTPSMTLLSMVERFPRAGLSRENMIDQQKKLAEKVKEIIQRDDVKEKIGDFASKCEIVYFDDSDPDNLGEVLDKQLQIWVQYRT